MGWKSGLLDPHSYVSPPWYPQKNFGRSQILGFLPVRYYQNFWGGFKIRWNAYCKYVALCFGLSF